MGQLAVMGRKGDTKIIWSADNADEVGNARRAFDDLRGKGFMAYAVADRGRKGEQITEFAPDAERLILVPPMRGG